MTYYSSSMYETNSVYSSNSKKSGFKIVGQCQGTCYTVQGCTCR